MFRSKKVLLILSVFIAAGIILTSTLAWSSLNQSSTSTFSGIVNPDVNLHDDSGKAHKNIFVENSGGEPLYVRVALSEWMQISGETVKSELNKSPIVGNDGTKGWIIHTPVGNFSNDCGEPFHQYYKWQMGDEVLSGNRKYYLATPFENRARFDSLGNQTSPPTAVTNTSSKFGTNISYDTVTMESAYQALSARLEEKYDSDKTVYQYLNSIYDSINDAIEAGDTSTQNTLENEINTYLLNPENKLGYYDKVFEVTAEGKISNSYQVIWKPILKTQKAQKVFTMSAWLDAGKPTGDFWIVDSDGWCYWGKKLLPAQATGLLLSGVTQDESNVPNGKWSYKITADLQAVTYDDISKFEETAPGGIGGITQNAKDLLNTISTDDTSSDGGTQSYEFTADGYQWTVIDDGSKTGKAVIISKEVLRANISQSNIDAYLSMYADGKGNGELTSIIALDPSAFSRLITASEANILYKDNASRIANMHQTQAPTEWWLSDGASVSADGNIQGNDLGTSVSGLRVAIELDSAKLNDLITQKG